MTYAFATRSLLLALACFALTSARAESLATSASSAGSSASSAGSASLRGSSDSIGASSNSSRTDEKVAAGEYRVAAIDPVPGRDDLIRLTMEPVPGHRYTGTRAARDAVASGFTLDLPRQAVGAQPIAAGDIVSARHRPYGIEFARGTAGDAFFLVLADDWQRDLQTRVLTN